jgi:hypothetical protein
MKDQRKLNRSVLSFIDTFQQQDVLYWTAAMTVRVASLSYISGEGEESSQPQPACPHFRRGRGQLNLSLHYISGE